MFREIYYIMIKAMARVDSIHKNYRKIKVVFTNGTEFAVDSTYSNDVMKLDVDSLTHPAWTKEANFINTKASEVTKFNDRYSSIELFKI